MTIGVRHFSHEFTFPATGTPTWASLVDRWYQLDPFAYGLAETYSKFQPQLPPPSLIYLASESASNETDWQFVKSDASSPSKFVHTLPSARASALCQVMHWSGPTICLQNGADTLTVALAEGAEAITPKTPRVWVISASRVPPLLGFEKTGNYLIHFFTLLELNSAPKNENHFDYQLCKAPTEGPSDGDRALYHWMSGDARGQTKIRIPYQFEIGLTQVNIL